MAGLSALQAESIAATLIHDGIRIGRSGFACDRVGSCLVSVDWSNGGNEAIFRERLLSR